MCRRACVVLAEDWQLPLPYQAPVELPSLCPQTTEKRKRQAGMACIASDWTMGSQEGSVWLVLIHQPGWGLAERQAGNGEGLCLPASPCACEKERHHAREATRLDMEKKMKYHSNHLQISGRKALLTCLPACKTVYILRACWQREQTATSCPAWRCLPSPSPEHAHTLYT